MKNMFKLAAVAVSMALVMSLAACSSGDDDVVDASTPKYLVAAQIDQYVASIDYNQNVSDDEIKSLGKAHEAVMDMLDGCADCLDAYFVEVKKIDYKHHVENDNKKEEWDSRDPIDSTDIKEAIKNLAYLKSYGTEKAYHKVYVYKPAIEKALRKLVWFGKTGDNYYISLYTKVRSDVDAIGDPEGDTVNTIRDGKLNDRQAASMKAYTDAYEALKAALSDDDSKKCETTIKAADDAIEAFGKLENKNVTNAEIGKVIAAVDDMCKDIQINIYATIEELER